MEEPDLPQEEYPIFRLSTPYCKYYVSKTWEFTNRMIVNHVSLTQDGKEHHLNPMPRTHFQILLQKS